MGVEQIDASSIADSLSRPDCCMLAMADVCRDSLDHKKLALWVLGLKMDGSGDRDLNALVDVAFGQDGEDWCLLYFLETPDWSA